jgi:hypothetical protein
VIDRKVVSRPRRSGEQAAPGGPRPNLSSMKRTRYSRGEGSLHGEGESKNGSQSNLDGDIDGQTWVAIGSVMVRLREGMNLIAIII